MDRLKTHFPEIDRIDVLVNGEDELLLLLNERKTTFKKQDLAFIKRHSLKTGLTTLRPSDVVRLVRHLNVDLYSTDIESITHVPGGYHITIRRECLIYCGTFKIKYRAYINEG